MFYSKGEALRGGREGKGGAILLQGNSPAPHESAPAFERAWFMTGVVYVCSIPNGRITGLLSHICPRLFGYSVTSFRPRMGFIAQLVSRDSRCEVNSRDCGRLVLFFHSTCAADLC